MLRFDPPPMHEDFDHVEPSNVIDTARKRVNKMVADGKEPTFPTTYASGVWGKTKYKKRLTKAQHHKCAYCEAKALPGVTGDIEHYAPKGAVQEIAVAGKEVDDLSNVEGRSCPEITTRGYWWLAYEWSNYVWACPRCNQAWKKALFPVAESPRQLPPQKNVQETPLLLHPFGNEDPVDHLRFNALGEICGISDEGMATIEVCGLWRESLRDARSEKAALVYDYLQEYAEAIAGGEDTTKILRRIVKAGAEDKVFAGMVRAIVRQELGLTWSQLEAAADNG